ncbi:MAG: cupin fold metalloprotein, WbuC family [Bacteroidetes bacterium HGW-Bacteroidetes-10]|nr:MAG: cupin fold metalloprotein, WbuC family [Bacteroidetes bacterium HGW-Bacteroidetes-10]
MLKIDDRLLDMVGSEAKASTRLRMNYNIHKSLDAPVQRLLNALEPGSVLPVHRHRNTDETYIVLRGAIKVMFYNYKGELQESCIFDPCDGNYGVNIPAGTWHNLEVLARGTVIFEVKEGPYAASAPEDILEING